MPQRAEEIVQFWEKVGPQGWYAVREELDAEIRDRFLPIWEEAEAGGLAEWRSNAWGALAYIILTDQFPRNMFRGQPRAFATDPMAREAALVAVRHDFDLKTAEPMRQFFYLPFMHSEDPFDQDRCVRLMICRLPETGAENLRHARAHRDIIRRYRRFPYRNAAVGRDSTPEEERFLAEGGYASALNALA